MDKRIPHLLFKFIKKDEIITITVLVLRLKKPSHPTEIDVNSAKVFVFLSIYLFLL